MVNRLIILNYNIEILFLKVSQKIMKTCFISLRRFVENVGFPCAVMLVSSDINFATDLSDLKNRKKIHVILVHGPLASEALLLCSNEHYIYDNFLEEVPSLSHTFQKVV